MLKNATVNYRSRLKQSTASSTHQVRDVWRPFPARRDTWPSPPSATGGPTQDQPLPRLTLVRRIEPKRGWAKGSRRLSGGSALLGTMLAPKKHRCS